MTPGSAKATKKIFPGFPAGRLKTVPLPALFFSEVLPLVDDLAELKVLLHVFWRLSGAGHPLKAVSWDELQSDPVLLRGLDLSAQDAGVLLRQAVEKASERGTLLRLKVRMRDDETKEWFFLNTETGRNLLNRVRRGEVDLGGDPLRDEADMIEERANIFVLYEQNIGLLQPLIAEELQEAELLYPMDWIEDAFRIAVENNVRNWRYIRAILERWRAEGKHDEEAGRHYWEDGRSYLKGKYSDIIKH